jgi:endo-1,4-beta-D-glucanase Y
MMAWRVTCDDIDDPGSATDGDVDVALSLIVAHYQWGEDYLDEALDVIEVIKNSVLVTCDDLLALGPGFSLQAGGDGRWGGCNLLDIMYHTPAFFRVFAEATGDTTWNTLADDTYVMLNASANEVTGLVPDWQSAGGMPGGDPPQPNRNPNYSYDACRVPWRIALDYLWNGNEEAKDWCKKVTNWADDIGAQNIVDGYTLDGEPLEGMRYHNNSFVGGFAVGAMCNSQTVADNFGTEMNSSTLRNDTYWFNLCTRAIYLFVMTGNFWKPEKLSSLNDRGIRAGEKVYPNPVFRGGTIFVEGIKGVDQIDILNLEGKIIKRITTTAQVKTEIRANLSPGYYFLRFLGLEDTLYVSLAVE